MPRTTRFEVPHDSALFSPLGLQPNAHFALAMSAWARWLRQHLVSFPRLVAEHKVGVVMAGIQAETYRPHGFFDGDAFEVEVGIRALKGGAILEGKVDYFARGERFASFLSALRPVLMAGDRSLAAQSGKLPDDLLARFQPDEQSAEGPQRYVGAMIEAIRGRATPLGEGRHDFRTARHACEVADQWSFTVMPGLFEEARSALARAHRPAAGALKRPLKRIDLELRRPFFLFDEGFIETQALDDGGALTFVHRVRHVQAVGGDDLAALAVEVF